MNPERVPEGFDRINRISKVSFRGTGREEGGGSMGGGIVLLVLKRLGEQFFSIIVVIS